MRTKYRRVLLAVFWLALAYMAFEGVKKLGEVTDFSVYYRAADAVRNGSSAYESEIPGRPTLPYVYPPVLSSLLLPLTFLGEPTAQGIWTVVNLAALLGCLFLVRRLVFFHADPVPLVIASFLLVFPFFRSTIRSGQIDLILFWMMLLPLCPGEGKRPFRSGLSLGTAIAIKMYPAGAMLGWFVGRKWKRIGSVMAVTVILSLLVPVVFLGPGTAMREIGIFWTELTPQLAGWKEAPDWYGYRTHHAYALPSAMYRWFSADSVDSLRPGTPPVQIVSLGTTAFWSLTALATGFWVLLAAVGLRRVERVKRRPFPEKHLLQAALVMGLIPIVGPMSLKPSFITLLPVYAALFAVPGATRALHLGSWFLAGAAITLHLFPFRPVFGVEFAQWLEGHSDILVGNLLLFFALWLRTVRLDAKDRQAASFGFPEPIPSVRGSKP